MLKLYSNGTQPSNPDASRQLASRIRALRDERGWTLEVASAHTGLSRSALSKIERHEMSPTFNALNKLAQGFGVSMSRLLEGKETDETSSVLVTRAGEGSVHTASQYHLRLLPSGLHDTSRLVVVEFTVEARDMSEFDGWDRHDDENFIYVLEGPINFHQEGMSEPLTLMPGDSICFDARIGHAFTRHGEATGRALSVTLPL